MLEVWAVPLVFVLTVASLGLYVGFLFYRVMLFQCVALSLTMVLGGRVR